MKRRQVFSGMVLPLVLGLLTATASIARGDDRPVSRTCSNATLIGSYGFYRTGTNAAGPLAAVGIISFDGKGNATSTQSISRNGDYEFDVSFPSLYDVAADCTGKALTRDGDEFSRLVVIDDGRGFYILSESGGSAIYGVGTRTH